MVEPQLEQQYYVFVILSVNNTNDNTIICKQFVFLLTFYIVKYLSLTRELRFHYVYLFVSKVTVEFL